MTNQIVVKITSGEIIQSEIKTDPIIEANPMIGHTHPNKSVLDQITEVIQADKTFVYEQNTPAKTWLITHTLEKYPSVTVVDSANTVIIGDVVYLSTSVIQLDFAGEFSGKAYLN